MALCAGCLDCWRALGPGTSDAQHLLFRANAEPQAGFKASLEKELVKRSCPRPKQHLPQHKVPPMKQQTLNTACTRHQQQVSSKPGFTRSNLNVSNTVTLLVPPPPSAYEISGFCKERTINRCCFIWFICKLGQTAKSCQQCRHHSCVPVCSQTG